MSKQGAHMNSCYPDLCMHIHMLHIRLSFYQLPIKNETYHPQPDKTNQSANSIFPAHRRANVMSTVDFVSAKCLRPQCIRPPRQKAVKSKDAKSLKRHTHTDTPRASDRPAKKQLSPKMQKAYVCIYTCSTYHTTRSQIQMSYCALAESPSARSQRSLATSNVRKCSNKVRMPFRKLNSMSSTGTSCTRRSHTDRRDSTRLPCPGVLI